MLEGAIRHRRAFPHLRAVMQAGGLAQLLTRFARATRAKINSSRGFGIFLRHVIQQGVCTVATDINAPLTVPVVVIGTREQVATSKPMPPAPIIATLSPTLALPCITSIQDSTLLCVMPSISGTRGRTPLAITYSSAFSASNCSTPARSPMCNSTPVCCKRS